MIAVEQQTSIDTSVDLNTAAFQQAADVDQLAAVAEGTSAITTGVEILGLSFLTFAAARFVFGLNPKHLDGTPEVSGSKDPALSGEMPTVRSLLGIS